MTKSFVTILKNTEGFQCLGGVSDDVISSAENELDIAFSNEYKEYLSSCGITSIPGHEFMGLGDPEYLNVIQSTIKQRQMNPELDKSCYVVEDYNIDGIVLLQNENGEVFLLKPGSVIEKVANSLAEYIENTRN